MKPSPTPPPAEPNRLLRDIYLERRARNASYSMRAFARDLGISQAYVSLILNGKKPLGLRQANRAAAVLGLDPDRSGALIHAVVERERTRGTPRRRRSADVSADPRALDLDRFAAIARWYHLAILDLTTTVDFRDDAVWIARRLGIEVIEARDGAERLLRLGFLQRRGDRLEKVARHARFETTRSEPAVRAFHREMIERAGAALDAVDPASFRRRSITSTTLAIDPRRLAQARRRIRKFEDEMRAFLTEGPTTEVYQLNLQFFPLTRRSTP